MRKTRAVDMEAAGSHQEIWRQVYDTWLVGETTSLSVS